jgi:hypothetical protein
VKDVLYRSMIRATAQQQKTSAAIITQLTRVCVANARLKVVILSDLGSSELLLSVVCLHSTSHIIPHCNSQT